MVSGSCFRFQGVVSVFWEVFPFSGKCFRFLGCVFVNLNLISLTLICLTGMGHRTLIPLIDKKSVLNYFGAMCRNRHAWEWRGSSGQQGWR